MGVVFPSHFLIQKEFSVDYSDQDEASQSCYSPPESAYR